MLRYEHGKKLPALLGDHDRQTNQRTDSRLVKIVIQLLIHHRYQSDFRLASSIACYRTFNSKIVTHLPSTFT